MLREELIEHPLGDFEGFRHDPKNSTEGLSGAMTEQRRNITVPTERRKSGGEAASVENARSDRYFSPAKARRCTLRIPDPIKLLTNSAISVIIKDCIPKILTESGRFGDLFCENAAGSYSLEAP